MNSATRRGQAIRLAQHWKTRGLEGESVPYGPNFPDVVGPTHGIVHTLVYYSIKNRFTESSKLPSDLCDLYSPAVSTRCIRTRQPGVSWHPPPPPIPSTQGHIQAKSCKVYSKRDASYFACTTRPIIRARSRKTSVNIAETCCPRTFLGS